LRIVKVSFAATPLPNPPQGGREQEVSR